MHLNNHCITHMKTPSLNIRILNCIYSVQHFQRQQLAYVYSLHDDLFSLRAILNIKNSSKQNRLATNLRIYTFLRASSFINSFTQQQITPYREAMSNIQRKQTENFVVIFLQEGATQFSKIKISIPTYKKVKQIYQYLQKQKSNPFKYFFITNKLKERAQFTEEKEIKEIKEEFKKDKNGNYVILCYEDKTKNADEKINTEGEGLREAKEGKQPKEKKDDKDNGCLVM